jgi:hypothetical protein
MPALALSVQIDVNKHMSTWQRALVLIHNSSRSPRQAQVPAGFSCQPGPNHHEINKHRLLITIGVRVYLQPS